MEKQNNNNKTLYGVIISLLALIVIGGGIWFISANSKVNNSSSATTSSEITTTTTPNQPPASTSNCFTAEEAWNHIGETGCVKFYVASPYRSSKDNVFLNEKSDYKNGFTAVVFSSATPNDDAVTLWGYKTIEVSGLIKTYQGHPEIIVNSASQVKIVQ